MNKFFEVVIKHSGSETKFVNCSLDNAIGLIQTDIYMRGIDFQLTIPKFWDIVFSRYENIKGELFEVISSGDIAIKRKYR